MEEEFSGFPDSSDIHEQVQLHYELAISDLESDISQLETESSKCQVLRFKPKFVAFAKITFYSLKCPPGTDPDTRLPGDIRIKLGALIGFFL